jgi:hypothetical protein
MTAEQRKANLERIKQMVRDATPSARRARIIKWYLKNKAKIPQTLRQEIVSDLWYLKKWIAQRKSERVLLALRDLRERIAKAESVINGKKGGRPIDLEKRDIIKMALNLEREKNKTPKQIRYKIAQDFEKTDAAVEKILQRHKRQKNLRT